MTTPAGADIDTLAKVTGRVRENIERVIEGNPTNIGWDLEATPDGKVTCGVWEVEIGAWNVVTDSWEFMTIISGHSELTEDGGETVVLKPAETLKDGDKVKVQG